MSENVSSAGERITFATTVIALAPFSAGYFLSYLFRAVNAIIEKDLVAEIGLSPAELGLVTAAYLGAFALFQLPLGVLLDRFGPRRVQTVLLSVAAGGALLFAIGNDVTMLTVGRALIGLGFAGGLMASFKAVVIWVSEPRRALANALVMSSGAIGLLVATQPVELATQAIGWRNVFLCLAGATFVVALLIFMLVPERKVAVTGESLWQQIKGLGGIFTDRAFLAITPLLATTAGAHIAIQTLWAGPWFRDVAGLDRDGVASSLLIMALAFLVGILSTGVIADWLVRRGYSVLTAMVCFLVLFLVAQLGIVVGLADEYIQPVWFLFGMLGQAAILAYPWLAAHFGAQRSGRAQTAANLAIFAAAFALQYAIGAVIEQFPQTAPGSYDIRAYQYAFGGTLILQVVALMWYWLNAAAFSQHRPA